MARARVGGKSGSFASAAVALLAFILFLKIAWVCDDAYIINRSVEQLVAGNGPRWNPHERVQVFTSPLWFGLLTGIRLLSTNVFLNAIVLSAAFFALTLLVLRTTLGDARRWIVATLALIASNGFFDYTTSGLESPLAYFLIALFVHEYLAAFRERAAPGRRHPRRRERALWWAGLVLLCRLDLVTLIAAPVVWMLVQGGTSWPVRERVRALLLPLLPLAAWITFAWLYYGAPLPNPAYAKVLTGIPRAELGLQGLGYIWVTLRHDSITVLVVLAGLVAALRADRAELRALGWAVALNLVYVIFVGGDFMLGRFLAFSYLVAIVVILIAGAHRWVTRPVWSGALVALSFYLLLYPHTPLNSKMAHRNTPPHPMGIADERGSYGPGSLWRYLRRDRDRPFPAHHWSEEGLAFSQSDSCCTYRWSVGYFGYWAGTDKRILDLNGLCDPLLAGLPMPANTAWRIGHFARPVPEGYMESIISGDNAVADPAIHAQYERVRVLTQSEPLFARERVRLLLYNRAVTTE